MYTFPPQPSVRRCAAPSDQLVQGAARAIHLKFGMVGRKGFHVSKA